MSAPQPTPSLRPALEASKLRWHCDPDELPFETTADLEEISGVVGQDSAVEALRFGLECDAPGQNVFVRGLTGTGRMTLVRHLLEGLEPKRRSKLTPCYVHNFAEQDRPRLIQLEAGQVHGFRRALRELAEMIRDHLSEALGAAPIKSERETIENRRQEEIDEVTRAFETDVKEAGLALVTVQRGPIAIPAVLPLHDGKPVAPEEFERLHDEGKVPEEQYQLYREHRRDLQKRLGEVTSKVQEIQRKGFEAIREVMERAARQILENVVGQIRAAYPGEDVSHFLDEVVGDVVENRLFGKDGEEFDPLVLYGLNVLLEHDDGEEVPIVVENTPTLAKLLGTIEREWGPHGPLPTDYRMIRAGSILRANGGYLILDARDVLTEPGAWKVLVRTLRTGFLEMVAPELGWAFWMPAVRPEPIPVKLRVILVGDAWIYHLLDTHDDDFSHLFKVLADFDNVIDRAAAGDESAGATKYAGVLARIAREEELPPFHKSAVAALVEHGARTGYHGKLTAKFGRIADVAREAAFLARRENGETVRAEHVWEAVERNKARADLPSRRFRELVRDGTFHVRIAGEEVGQLNGLAMIHAGPISYGFPARITATIGAGSAGIVDIEEQSALSGSLHTKGFHILGGLLRHLLRTDHPLAFTASLAFEQSYGTIDGDSASGAEICCLLSALTGVPIRQSVAMTGSIDQLGRIQAIGGVNEKIEGFFATCADAGLTGEQGVIVPASNVGDLMLRREVVEACETGRFHVWSVSRVEEALEILTGMEAGERGEDGDYPAGTLLGMATEKAREYWLKSVQKPPGSPAGVEEAASKGGDGDHPDSRGGRPVDAPS